MYNMNVLQFEVTGFHIQHLRQTIKVIFQNFRELIISERNESIIILKGGSNKISAKKFLKYFYKSLEILRFKHFIFLVLIYFVEKISNISLKSAPKHITDIRN